MKISDFYLRNKRLLYFILFMLFSAGNAYYGCLVFVREPSLFSDPIFFTLRITWLLFYEILCLVLLAFVLLDRGESLLNFGLSLKVKDFLHSLTLSFGSLIGIAFCATIQYLFGHFVFKNPNPNIDMHLLKAFNNSLGILPFYLIIPFIFLNPVFEELIMRSFFMTELNFFIRKGFLVVLLSALIQAGYHLYQGWDIFPMHFIHFFVYSVYYQKTKRITPVVLSHFYFDAYGILRTVF